MFEHRYAAVGVLAALAVAAPATTPRAARAQVTTASLAGRVTSAAGATLAGAQIVAVHRPSGTTYRATTRADGRFTIPGMRVGGPYQVTVRALGFAPDVRDDLALDLGQQLELAVRLAVRATQLSAVTVSGVAERTNTARTGAATRVGREQLATLPTISRTINDFTRLTPQAGANGSFAGADNRANNITVDGSFFNNAFGLGTGQPGGRTSVAPLPLDALDQIQVNVAPFDVRQGNFVGAGVNAVTRSGTNNFEGSAYRIARNNGFVGTEAAGAAFNPGSFTFEQYGARLGGPILRNKLFFFVSGETDKLQQPATTFQANAGGQTVGGAVTRVLRTDLDSLSRLLQSRFNYTTGPYAGYNFETPSDRILAKLDWNANDANKLSLRYTYLKSSTDVPPSNSNSLGFGNRQGNIDALSFANSAYAIGENINSLVGEWNAQFGSRASNNLIVGYTKNDESRIAKGAFFPFVDILQGNTTYASFGFEPFTPANQLRYRTYQAQDNFTLFLNKHEVTLGGTYQNYRSENVFYPGSQSVYVYNSLADFFTDANDYAANPNRTTSPVTLRTFQVRYLNVPGLTEPLQPLQVNQFGAYAQDQWRPTANLRVTAGIRADLPVFDATGYTNAQANAFTFRDPAGGPVRFRTQDLPKANVLWSPRLGLNWDVRGDRSTVLRGGTGVFTGQPAYVWISNQIGQNGILTGFDQQNNTTARPFNPNPDAYKPTTVTGAPAASYELNFTDRSFRFPQVWRSSAAIDQSLPFGVRGTVEYIYGRDVNGMAYYNANLPAAQAAFNGADTRPRWTANRINGAVNPGAYVLTNQSVGFSSNIAASLEKAFTSGFYAKAAYSYGVAKNTIDPGSIATGTFNGNAVARDPNNAPLAHSAFSPGHRYFVALSYRAEYLKAGATTFSLFAEGRTLGNASYTYAGDMNGDGAPGNDLVYVPRAGEATRFEQYAQNGVTYTVAQQQAAWQRYIDQDRYLSERRGRYAERNAAFLPTVLRTDASIAQDVSQTLGGKRNTLQLRLDVFNLGNLMNAGWGVGQRFVTTQPLLFQRVDAASGEPVFRFRQINNQLVGQTFQKTAGINDVFRLQLGLRYSFQ